MRIAVLVALGWACSFSIVAAQESMAAAGEEAEQELQLAQAHLEQAEFQEALALYNRMFRDVRMEREQLVRVLWRRAFVLHIIGDSAAAGRDLTALGSLEPDFNLPPDSPPSLTRAFNSIDRGTRLGVHCSTHALEVGVHVQCRVVGDPSRLAQHVRVHYRSPTGAWEVVRAPASLPGPVEGLAYFGEAVGPGGAVLARDGARDRPHRVASSMVVSDTTASSGDDELYLGLGLGIGAALLVGIIVGVIVVSTQSTEFSVTGPAER